MGTPDTTDTAEIATESLLTVQELARLDGIVGKDRAHPAKLFGPDWEKEGAPPHVKSYGMVRSAFYGQLEAWFGFCSRDAWQKKAEFQSFSAITEGLTLDERMRFAIILTQYLKDITRMISQGKSNMLQLETLADARKWIDTLIRTADLETRLELSKMGDPTIQHYFPVSVAEQSVPAQAVESTRSSVYRHLKS